MTDEQRPGKEAREIVGRSLEPFAPSRTQLKKMVGAVMAEWQPAFAGIADSDDAALILYRRIVEDE